MTAASEPVLEPVSFSAIHGWKTDDLSEALAAFRRSCAEINNVGRAFDRTVRFGGGRQDWLHVCAQALSVRDARSLLEEHFQPYRPKEA
jgi:membrane-bound lytic murein transglycosylase A